MHSIQHEQYKMSLNYHHLAKCSFSSFKLAKMAKFDFFIFSKKKDEGFLGPSQLSENPPNVIFYTFIRISFLFPFILYSSQHFIGVILLIFFDVFKNLAPKWPFFWDFYSWPYLKNPLLFFKALLPMQGAFVVIHFHFSCFFSQMMF